VFGVGDEEINMAVGDCWEINNSKIHYVNNYSEVDRIHLLVDILPVRELG
jgi:aspartyl/asparaginyl beta-hydroxylase (cupin superfamily)